MRGIYSLSNLHLFSEKFAVQNLPSSLNELHTLLQYIADYNFFPAVSDDVGAFLSFICKLLAPKKIFEFGSGYGQSAFWFLSSGVGDNLEKIYMTERRENLWDIFASLPWPSNWRSKMDYYQGDAFERLKEISEIDLALIDGQKSRYFDFFNLLEKKLSANGVVIVDNAFWKGNIKNILDEDPVCSFHKKMSKSSIIGIRKFYQYILDSKEWKVTFIPFDDGILLINRS